MIIPRLSEHERFGSISLLQAGVRVVGEPEIQKLEKSGRKVAEFLTISSISMVFQKYENRYCTNFKSCKRCLFVG